MSGPYRTAGEVAPPSAKYIEERIGIECVRLRNRGRKEKTARINPDDFKACVERLGAKVVYEGEPFGPGFVPRDRSLFRLNTAAGVVTVKPDSSVAPDSIQMGEAP